MATLSPTVQKFVLHWGEMGARWGVNRTVAQIHALLYLSSRPLNAEDIAETLSVARSNVSTSLRELQSWGLVRTIHVMGDRRDHYQTMTDVWEMFRIVLDERRKREIEPTIRILRECVAEIEHDRGADKEAPQRLRAMLDFFETTTAWYDQVRKLPAGALHRLAKLGPKVRKLLGAA